MIRILLKEMVKILFPHQEMDGLKKGFKTRVKFFKKKKKKHGLGLFYSATYWHSCLVMDILVHSTSIYGPIGVNVAF